jgi:hypothetical protein
MCEAIGADPKMRTGLPPRRPAHALGAMIRAQRSRSTWGTGPGTTVREPRLGTGAGAHEDQLVICLIGQKAYRGHPCQDRELRDIASNK